MKTSLKERFDCFIIWQNGASYIFEILDKISQEGFEILEIKKINTNSISKFIKLIYSHDYAPYIHLKSKLKYLKHSKNKFVYFIVVLNKNKNEILVGNGSFKHIESKSMNSLKWGLRNEFNEKDLNGEVSHNHIIHGTDSEEQAMFLLKKFKIEIDKFLGDNLFQICEKGNRYFKFQKKGISELNVNILTNRGKIKSKISETPHFLFLKNDFDETYKKYLLHYLGIDIKKFHTPQKFKNLFELKKNNSDLIFEPIIIDENNLILDGAHRAAICCYLNYKEINTIVVS